MQQEIWTAQCLPLTWKLVTIATLIDPPFLRHSVSWLPRETHSSANVIWAWWKHARLPPRCMTQFLWLRRSIQRIRLECKTNICVRDRELQHPVQRESGRGTGRMSRLSPLTTLLWVCHYQKENEVVIWDKIIQVHSETVLWIYKKLFPYFALFVFGRPLTKPK